MTEEDAQRDRNEFEDLVKSRAFDAHIESEINGEKPPGGVKTWNKFWLTRIKYLSKDLEENQAYIDHIKNRRREAGLPPLAGGD